MRLLHFQMQNITSRPDSKNNNNIKGLKAFHILPNVISDSVLRALNMSSEGFMFDSPLCSNGTGSFFDFLSEQRRSQNTQFYFEEMN